MFLTYYNLKINPFKISSDPKFLWMGEKHREALATLTYGIAENKGFLLLTGDVGSGKTTLINALLNNLDSSVLVAVISDPGLSPIDFFNYIGYLLNFNKTFQSKGEFLIHFSMFLNGIYMANKQVLLIIDEAQRIPNELLEEIRLLSNIERQDTKLINIFFVGQNEFNTMLMEDSSRALRQRITLNYHIESLDEREIALYIQHRLKIAGGKIMLFSADAITEIYRYSGGYPRQINIICDLALLTGYVKGEKKIGGEIIRECVKELNIPEKFTKQSSIQAANSETDSKIGSNHNTVSANSPNSAFGLNAIKRRRYLLFVGSIMLIVAVLFYLISSDSQKLDPIFHGSKNLIMDLYGSINGRPQEKSMASVAEDKIIKSSAEDVNGHKDNDSNVSLTDESNKITMEQSENIGRSSSLSTTGNPEISLQGKKDTPTYNINKSDQEASQIKDDNNILGKDDKAFNASKNENLENTVQTPTSNIESGSMNDSLKTNMNSESIKESNNNDLNQLSNITNQKAVNDNIDKKQSEMNISEVKDDDSQKLTDTTIASYLKKKVTINFGYNTNDLTRENQFELRQLSQILKTDRNRKIKITGHSDSNGNASYNMQLSQFRANIVKSFMVGSGAEPEQLIVVGKGGEEPVADNQTAQGRQLNRRVELQFIEN